MYIVVFVTTKDEYEANAIAQKLLADHLVACVNIIPKIKSIFSWQGKVDQAEESLLILKSQQKFFSDLVKAVKAVHSYDCPEIIALPIIEGSEDYLKWIKTETEK